MSKPMRIVIVDDEAPARQLLKEYIAAFPDCLVVAECKNGIEAISIINVLEPDLVFLDIQMPGKTGLEVIPELNFIPKIIFATAYDQYAVEAFEANALDYLLKPFHRERFEKALTKACTADHTSLQNIVNLSAQLQNKTYPERILVEQGNKWVTLLVQEIQWLQAEGDYTQIHAAGKKFISSKGIGELESKLDPQYFQRVHRSAIVAISAIKEIHREPSGPQIVLIDGTVLKVSRSYVEAVRKLVF